MARNGNRADSMRLRRKLLGAIALLAALLTALTLGGRWLEKQYEKSESRGELQPRYGDDTVLEYEGSRYRLRRNMITLLLMGVDKSGGSERTGYRSGGQADFLRLVVMDHGNQRVTQLAIDRDTMTPITTLGVLGNRSGVRTAQISLSHAFGDGGEESCHLTVDAVSGLLFDVPVDFYAAMNLDGIPVLNDAVGGVTVTLADDFTALDPVMTVGSTLKLQGKQAEYYVRSRRNLNIGTNEARMARQETYIAQLIAQLHECQEADHGFTGRLYDALGEYLVTDLSRGQMINEAWAVRAYERAALIQPEGVHQVGTDGFMQFIPDQDALRRTVMELFYEEVK